MNTYQIQKAIEIAGELRAGDGEWEFDVVPVGMDRGRVDVYDEEGYLVHQGY